jgi:hypothetical protein
MDCGGDGRDEWGPWCFRRVMRVCGLRVDVVDFECLYCELRVAISVSCC